MSKWENLRYSDVDSRFAISVYLYKFKAELNRSSNDKLEWEENFSSWSEYNNFSMLVQNGNHYFYNLGSKFEVEEKEEISPDKSSPWYYIITITFENNKKLILKCIGKLSLEERLNCRIADLKENNKVAKKQAVKEFAEKLKEKCSDYLYHTNFDGKNDFDIHIGEISRIIDELLKEYEK